MPSASSQQKPPVLGDFCARNQSRISGETWLYCPLSRASAGAQMKSTSSTTRNIFGLSNVGPCSVCGRSTENRHAKNDYACMNGSSREQYIWQSPSVLPRTITNAHRSFRFPCPRLRLPPRELHCCGACCSNRNDKCDPIFADAKADAPTEPQHERATIRATAIPVGRQNKNFHRRVRRQWSGPLQHHLMAWRIGLEPIAAGRN